jgi:hypothetical protein
MTRKSVLCLALAAAFVLTGGLATVSTVTAEPDKARSTAAQGGVTPATTAEWWQWALSIPTSVHPLVTDPDTPPSEVDPSSAFCMVGQHGAVWFLGGTFKEVDLFPDGARPQSTADNSSPATPDITRECKIPLGTAILMPVINASCNTAEEIHLNNPAEIDDLRNCAGQTADLITSTEASFGRAGEPQRPLNVRRVRTPLPFSVTYAPDHILQSEDDPWEPDPNPSLAFADGYFVLVKPLRAGTYELNTFGDAPSVPFSLRIKYILEIVGPEDQ